MKDENNNLYQILDKAVAKVKAQQLKKGDLVEGIVEKITPEYVVVRIYEVYTAVISSSEINSEVLSGLKVGDILKVYVIKTEDEYGNIVVSQKRTTAGQKWDVLIEASKNDTTLFVNVLESNSGGVLVNYEGITGFIPASQLDPNKVYKLESEVSSKEDLQREVSKKLSETVGSKLAVKIVEVDKHKNKVIFSERLAMTEQSVEQRSQLLKNSKVGEVMNAVVTAITPYGIFVNAQGLDGLIHVSEISWDKVDDPANHAKVGDKIKVKLIDLDSEGKRVAYSIKQLSNDPWESVVSSYKVGGEVEGEISNLEEYGLIIKLGDGITGLVHKTEVTEDKESEIKSLYKVGDKIKAVILTISPSDRKMGLSIKRLESNGSTEKKTAKKKKVEKKGLLDIDAALEKAKVSKSKK